ncbi:MAG TPA: lytic transglycosylase domain-containing protein [Streptosporangiaceae bacterium]|nr:lytic transglycosylase domain-containing protein [Streptosporangiaceae bacterium]
MSSTRLLNRTVTTRLILALSAPAFAVTAIAVGGGLSATAAAAPAAPAAVVNLAGSASTVTDNASVFTIAGRHNNPNLIAPTKKHKKKHHKKHKAHKKPLRSMAPKQIAWHIMSWFHWHAKSQFRYLNRLWMRESSWNKYATNPWSGAYGIPQAVPGSKMSSVGADWRTSAETQIRWGMRYIKSVYGSPRNAWYHEVNDGWY